MFQLIFLFIIFCACLLVAFFKPYKRNIYNFYDIAMLTFLFLVTCATMYRWETTIFAGPSLACDIFVYILFSMLFLIAVGFVLICLCAFVGRKCYIRQLAWSGNRTIHGYFTTTFLRDIPSELSIHNDNLPDRLITLERYSHDEVSRAAARSYGIL